LGGLIPSPQIVYNPNALYIAIGILGATVMPHNLYLHSSIVQTRNFARDDSGKALAIKFASIDSTVSLLFAFVINAAILILAAVTFPWQRARRCYRSRRCLQLTDAHPWGNFCEYCLWIGIAGIGAKLDIDGHLGWRIVMEGFLEIRLPRWVIRLITRGIAIIPAIIVAILYGERGTGELLVLSQVILALQLGFAVVPLVTFTSDKTKMGKFVDPDVADNFGMGRHRNNY
jgi:manganese transport protein